MSSFLLFLSSLFVCAKRGRLSIASWASTFPSTFLRFIKISWLTRNFDKPSQFSGFGYLFILSRSGLARDASQSVLASSHDEWEAPLLRLRLQVRSFWTVLRNSLTDPSTSCCFPLPCSLTSDKRSLTEASTSICSLDEDDFPAFWLGLSCERYDNLLSLSHPRWPLKGLC